MQADRCWQFVREFHHRFEHPVAQKPTRLNRDRVAKRYKWMLEELEEFISACDIYEQADAMIDLIYFALGTLVEMGIRPDPLFDIVHRANMGKLWEDGKPHYNDEGKTIKPVGWQDPYDLMMKEIDRQMNGDASSEKDKITWSKYAYDLIIAEPFLCVPALLEMIIRSCTQSNTNQRDIAEFLGIWVPEEYTGSVSKINITPDKSKWGVIITNNDINRVFEHFQISLKEIYTPISTLHDWMFSELIKAALSNGTHLICGYSYGQLFGQTEINIGHASLITAISESGEISLLDPGPDDPGTKIVDEVKLYSAIHAKRDGLWQITVVK